MTDNIPDKYKTLPGYGKTYGELELRTAIAYSEVMLLLHAGEGNASGSATPDALSSAIGTSKDPSMGVSENQITTAFSLFGFLKTYYNQIYNIGSDLIYSNGLTNSISTKIGTSSDAPASYSDDAAKWTVPSLFSYLTSSIAYLSNISNLLSNVPTIAFNTPSTQYHNNQILTTTGIFAAIVNASADSYVCFEFSNVYNQELFNGTFSFTGNNYNGQPTTLPFKRVDDPTGTLMYVGNNTGLYVVNCPCTDISINILTLNRGQLEFAYNTKRIYSPLLEPNLLSEGTEINGLSLPSGTGFRGWISWLYKLINDRLPVLLVNGKMPVDSSGQIISTLLFTKTFNAPGVGDSIPGNAYRKFTAFWKVRNINNSVTVRFEGSPNGVDWFDTDANGLDLTITSNGNYVLYITDSPLSFIRLNYISQSGSGSATTIETNIMGSI